MQSLAWQQAWFTLGMLICGGLEAAMAYGLVGPSGAEGAVYATLLCSIPGWLTIYASGLMRRNGLAVYIVLLGTVLRMAFVLMGLFVVGTLRQDFGFRDFTVWLIVSYMVALAIETLILVRPASAGAAQ